MRIGIFGGTFDPPHLGHIAVAKAAIEALDLSEVLFVPSNRNPLKHGRSTPAKQRLEMVNLAIEAEADMAASNIEIVRGGQSYAVDTLQELTFVRPAEYWFILGADALKTLSLWKQPVRLLKMCRLAAFERPGTDRVRITASLPEFALPCVDWIETSPSDISSSEVRLRMKSGRPCAEFLNPGVMRYIRRAQAI